MYRHNGFAFFVIFLSMSDTSKVNVSSTSAITGIALAATTAETEATKVYAGTITSSPGCTPAAISDVSSALVQEFTASAYFVPVLCAKAASKASTFDSDSNNP